MKAPHVRVGSTPVRTYQVGFVRMERIRSPPAMGLIKIIILSKKLKKLNITVLPNMVASKPMHVKL